MVKKTQCWDEKNPLGREQRKWCELFACLSCASMVFMYHVTNQLKEPITASFSWTLSGLICEVSQYFSRKRWVDERSFSLYVKRHFFGVKPQTVFHIIIIYISNRKIQQATRVTWYHFKTFMLSTDFNLECQSPSREKIMCPNEVTLRCKRKCFPR